MGISEDHAKNYKKIILAIVSGIVKGLIKEGLKKIGAGEVASAVCENVTDAVSDIADDNVSGWLEKLYENKQLSNKIEEIYKSETEKLIKANEAYSEMFSLMEFASLKSDTAIFKENVVNSIDEWRNYVKTENRTAPNISDEEIKTFLDKLYHNIEIAMADDKDLQIFWSVIRNTRKAEEIQETLNELIEQSKSSNDMLTALYNKQEYIKDNTAEYFENYYSPLCIHRGEVENIVTLKDVFVMPDVEIEDETKKLDIAVRDFIRGDAHEAMLLLGHGGFGKTSFVSYMAANKYYFCENRPLHIIRLREYSKSSIDELCDDIAGSDKRGKLSKDAVIVFDGLDELCMIAGGNGEDKAAKIIDKLVKQFYDYLGNDKRKIIITSRPGFVSQDNKKTEVKRGRDIINLVQANYVSFDKAKRDEFVEKIEKADTRLTEEDKKAGCDYIKSIEKSDKISDIYSSPFILYLICCVQINGDEIDSSKLGNSWYLFRKIFHDLYMESQYKYRTYNVKMEETFEENRDIIYEKTCEFAFEMFKKGLGKDDVIRLDDNDEELEGFKDCYALSCYFNKKNDGVIEFSHNYIRDFFICEYILKELNKVIGEDEFTEEKGRIVADWCSENLLYGEVNYKTIILDLICDQFEANDDTYKNFYNINEENIPYVFDWFAVKGALTARVLNNIEFYATFYDIEDLISNIIKNSQLIFVSNLRIREYKNSIKLIREKYVNDNVINSLSFYNIDMSCVELNGYDVKCKYYDSKTIFHAKYDPQAHGMIYELEENEMKEKLGNIPPLIRRQMRLEIDYNRDWVDYPNPQNIVYHYKYDPIKNALIDINSVCMTPDDRDSVININTVCEGETIRFSNYEWVILKADIETRKMLVLSKCVIAYLPFNEKDEAVTWENCTLRNWLNNEFIKEFSNLERERIIETDIDGVNDKIFLLSKQEYIDYEKILGQLHDAISRTIDSNNMVSIHEFISVRVIEHNNVFPALWLKF